MLKRVRHILRRNTPVAPLPPVVRDMRLELDINCNSLASRSAELRAIAHESKFRR